MKKYESILITGASSGLGKALAIEYAKPGILLFLMGRNRDRLAEVADICENKGAHVVFNSFNIGEKDSVGNFILNCNGTRKIDLIIANAGVSFETCEGRVYEIFETNIFGVLNTIEPIIPEMIKNKNGQIAIVSSMSSFIGLPSCPAYSSSKACVSAYGESLRGSLKQYNIGVSTICPGFIKTPLTDKNKFKMPLIISSEKAAKIIVRGLAKNKGLIVFPKIIYFIMRIMRFLPYDFTNFIVSKLPRK